MTVISRKIPDLLGPEPTEDIPGVTRPMSYEEYLAGPEEMRRYDIVDGYKKYRLYGPEGEQLPNPTRLHQQIQLNLSQAFLAYKSAFSTGRVILPPCDVFITRSPGLRTRQPDLIFVSNEVLARNLPPDNPAPLDPAPELVVEILSPSDRPSVLAAKIADYHSVGVHEIWLVRWRERTVEVIALSWDEIATVATYGTGDVVASVVFPGLTVTVDDIFAD